MRPRGVSTHKERKSTISGILQLRTGGGSFIFLVYYCEEQLVGSGAVGGDSGFYSLEDDGSFPAIRPCGRTLIVLGVIIHMVHWLCDGG